MVTDFRLHHTCSIIIWLHSLSGVNKVNFATHVDSAYIGIIIISMCKVKSMDDNCREWVECMGVVSRRWVWLVGVGEIYGCG